MDRIVQASERERKAIFTETSAGAVPKQVVSAPGT